MPIVITCPNPNCGRRYTVPDEAAGRSATCASCGSKIQIAGGGQVSKAPPPPPPPSDFDDLPPRRGRGNEVDADFDVVDEGAQDEGLPSVQRRRGGKPVGSGGFKDFVMFRILIAPSVMIIFYWLAVVAILLFGLLVMAAGFLSGNGVLGILGGLIGGLFLMIVGPFVIRINFEFMIVMFRIYDTLVEIRDNTTPHK